MEGDPPSKSPQLISQMFQKFALAFNTKTDGLFAEDSSPADVDVTFLGGVEEFIADQNVVVIKPDTCSGRNNSSSRFIPTLIPSLFGALSSFEASYVQFQAAHEPETNQNVIELADRLIVSIFQKLTELKNCYKDSMRNSLSLNCPFEFEVGSFFEYLVQENQSKLRALETTVDSLQSQIDAKEDEVRILRKKLDKVSVINAKLSWKLEFKEERIDFGMEVLLKIRVFEAMLRDSVKSLRCFTKLLIELLRRAGWDLEEAASSIHSDVEYKKKGHFCYAFLSFVCLGMCQNFDKSDFGLCDYGTICSGDYVVDRKNNGYLKQLIEHVTLSPMEILSRNPKCEFSRFCERKYEELIHPTIESSIFTNLNRKEKVLDSWKSINVFYESFVRMASSMWLLHKLAYSFTPAVEIFQVERGVKFSMVYMEDVVKQCSLIGKTGLRVGFTVMPGFKVGRTIIIQSQVHIRESRIDQQFLATTFYKG